MTPGIYKHRNGGLYEALMLARPEGGGPEVVVYRSLTDGKVWTRPYRHDGGRSSTWEDTCRWPDGEIRPRFIPEPMPSVGDGHPGVPAGSAAWCTCCNERTERWDSRFGLVLCPDCWPPVRDAKWEYPAPTIGPCPKCKPIAASRPSEVGHVRARDIPPPVLVDGHGNRIEPCPNEATSPVLRDLVLNANYIGPSEEEWVAIRRAAAAQRVDKATSEPPLDVVRARAIIEAALHWRERDCAGFVTAFALKALATAIDETPKEPLLTLEAKSEAAIKAEIRELSRGQVDRRLLRAVKRADDAEVKVLASLTDYPIPPDAGPDWCPGMCPRCECRPAGPCAECIAEDREASALCSDSPKDREPR